MTARSSLFSPDPYQVSYPVQKKPELNRNSNYFNLISPGLRKEQPICVPLHFFIYQIMCALENQDLILGPQTAYNTYSNNKLKRCSAFNGHKRSIYVKLSYIMNRSVEGLYYT